MSRFIRPTITVIALTGFVAIGALFFAPQVTQQLFTPNAQPTAQDTTLATAESMFSAKKIPATLDELELLADSLRQAQAEQDQQAKTLSAVAPASGDTAQ